MAHFVEFCIIHKKGRGCFNCTRSAEVTLASVSFFICEVFSKLAHTHRLKSSRRDGPVEKFTLTSSRVQEFKSSRFHAETDRWKLQNPARFSQKEVYILPKNPPRGGRGSLREGPQTPLTPERWENGAPKTQTSNITDFLAFSKRFFFVFLRLKQKSACVPATRY